VTHPALQTRLLGVSIHSPRVAWMSLLFATIVTAGSSNFDLGFYDSAELALVARQGGLGHPIGQPLHSLLGYLLSSLGVGLGGIHLLSIIPAVLCIVPTLSLAERWSPKPAERRLLRAFIVGLAPLHIIFFDPSTRVEVYALSTLPALWALARWAEIISSPSDADFDGRFIFNSGIALGLSACSNPYIAVIAALIGSPLLFLHWHRRGVLLKGARLTALGGIIGLVPFLYVLWAIRRQGVFVWGYGDLRSFLLGLDFALNRSPASEPAVTKLVRFSDWAASSWLFFPWLIGTLGELRKPTRYWCLSAWVLSNLLLLSNTTYLPEIPDYLGYLMVPLSLTIASASATVTSIPSHGLRFAVVASLIASLMLPAPSIFQRTRSRDHVARELSEFAINSAPRGSIIVVGSDHFVFPLLYLQAVERVRPDLVVYVWGLSSSSWYWHFLHSSHTDLVQIDLRGSRDARLRRFIAAQGARPVLFESVELGQAAHARLCAGTIFLQSTPCVSDDQVLARSITRWTDSVQSGSPATDTVLAHLAFERGELLWALDRPAAALDAFLSAVPAHLRLLPHEFGSRLSQQHVSHLHPPRPRWRRPSPLGRPERNLFRAAQLLAAAGQPQEAATLHVRAAQLGLEEAIEP